MPDSPPLLHVYGQGAWHEDAYIVGNIAGLIRLYAAVGAACRSLEHHSSIEVSTNDGEGYAVHIIRLEDAARWIRLAVPYTADVAEERRESAIWPPDLRVSE